MHLKPRRARRTADGLGFEYWVDGYVSRPATSNVVPPPPPPVAPRGSLSGTYITFSGSTPPPPPPPPDGSQRPAVGTFPNEVRYEDLSGSTLQTKLNNAAAMVSSTTRIVVTFPPGLFTFSDFSQLRTLVSNTEYSMAVGLRIPQNVSIAGSGSNAAANGQSLGPFETRFQMVALSSTVKPYVPLRGYGLTNNFSYMGVFNTIPNLLLQHFSLIGTNQDHLYNGLRIEKATGTSVVHHLYLEGFAGDQAAPPGETFGINIYKGGGIYLHHLEVNGIRSRQGGTTSICSSPLGFNSHDGTNAKVEDCYFHDCYIGMPTTWDDTSAMGITWRRNRSHRCKTGFNHERVKKSTHESDDIIKGANPHHYTFMNDLFDGLLVIREPTWDHNTSGGKLVIQMGPRSAAPGFPDLQVTPAVVTRNGVDITKTEVVNPT